MLNRLRHRLLPGVRDVLVRGVLASQTVPRRMRVAGLRRYGVTIGEVVSVSPRVRFYGREITIGDNSFIGEDVRIEPQTTIGRECAIGVGCSFITTSHKMGGHQRRAAEHVYAPIAVGGGCWFGAGVTVLPGVTVGAGCVIGAGAVVTSDCQPDGVFVGVPARRVRDLD